MLGVLMLRRDTEPDDLIRQRVELAVLRVWDRSCNRIRVAQQSAQSLRRALENRPDAALIRRILPGVVAYLLAEDPTALVALLRRAGIEAGDDPVAAALACREQLLLVDDGQLTDAVAEILSERPAATRAVPGEVAYSAREDVGWRLPWLADATRSGLAALAEYPPGVDGRGRLAAFVGPAGSGKQEAAVWLLGRWRRYGLLEGIRPVTVSAPVLFSYHNTWRTLSGLRRGLVVVTGLAQASDGGYLAAPEDLAGLVEALTSPSGPTLLLAARSASEVVGVTRAHPDLAGLTSTPVQFPQLTPTDLTRAVESHGRRLVTFSPAPDAVRAFGDALAELQTLPGWAGVRSARRLHGAATLASTKRMRTGASGRLVLEEADIRLGLEALAPRPAGDDLDAVLAELDGFTAAEEAKEAVADLLALHAENRRRHLRGLGRLDTSRHLLLLGPPGTGKTTFARLLGRIAYAAGFLSRPDVTEASRADLIAGYIGQTAIRTRAVVDSAAGGVLLIDEAYALRSASDGDFAAEALAVLVAEMENRRDSLLVIFAGYEQPTLRMLDDNPGLASRIGYHIRFPTLTLDQRVALFVAEAKRLGYEPDTAALEAARRRLAPEIGAHDDGNARSVRRLVQQVAARRARRVGDPTGGHDPRIVTADFPPADRDTADHELGLYL